MEIFFNRRISRSDSKMALEDYTLGICHLDVAPRNILWLEDGSICLLDWKSAGFYPRLLEVCMQRINVEMDGHFNELLLASMERLTDKEEAQAQLVLQAYSNGMKYYL